MVLRSQQPLARTLASWVPVPLKVLMCACVYSVFVLPCVQVAALRRADPPSKESRRRRKIITELNKRPGPLMGWKSH
jgi:hypothetical protein